MPLLTQGKTNWKYILILLISAVIVGGGSFWWVKMQKVPPIELLKIEKSEEEVISNFEECVAKGYPVLESYPRQCKTPDGETFVEKIDICQEKAKTINKLIKQSNYCDNTSDCLVLEVMEDINFPRYYTAVNGNTDLTELNKKIEEYRASCNPYFPCIICRRFTDKIKNEVECIENKCLITYGFIKDVDLIDTSDWKIYRNKEIGFEFKYPPETNRVYKSSKHIAITFERGSVSLNWIADSSFEKCMNPSLLRKTAFKKKIEGIDFYYYTNYPEDFGAYCGMHSGCQYIYVYRVFYRDYCYELKLGTYSPSEETLKIFNQMLSTFRFLE